MKNFLILALTIAVSSFFGLSCQKTASAPPPQLSNRSPDSVLSYRSCSSGCPITLDVENANWEPGDYVLFIYPNENNPSTNDYKAVISTTSLPISACAGAGTVYVYIYGGPAAAYVDVVDCQDANAQEFHLVYPSASGLRKVSKV